MKFLRDFTAVALLLATGSSAGAVALTDATFDSFLTKNPLSMIECEAGFLY